MKKLILLVLFITSYSVSLSQVQLVPLGELEPFWRNHPVLGPSLQNGMWIDKVPDYFFNNDFPYKKRPFEKEVLFADHLSVVRLMGGTLNYPGVKLAEIPGINDDGSMKKAKFDANDRASFKMLSKYDFAYRKDDGSLGFRPELIAQRLSPYLDLGYKSFTIVLDNIPWGLRKKPIIGAYGQIGPPDDPDEWYATVRELCKTLKKILGDEDANNLRFRIGTEMNRKERFGGTEDQFITHFDYAAAAIADVLPKARLSLYNINAASVSNIKTEHNVNAFNVLEHASRGKNRKTGKPNDALPFVAASRYYSEVDDLNQIVDGIDEVWDYIQHSIPGYNDLSREIHEFGAYSDWDAKPKTNNPGAFGNAMNLQVVINLLSKGLDKLFLWNMLEDVPRQNGSGAIQLPSSMLWGYNVLDYMVGGEAYQVLPEKNKIENDTEHTALLSVFENKAYLLVSAFNPDRNSHDTDTVTFKIPKKNIPFEAGEFRSTTLNNSNSIHYNLRKAIEKEGILNPALKNRPEYIPRYPRDMTNDKVKFGSLVTADWDHYTKLWKNSLTLNNFEGKVGEDEKYLTISIKTTTPESTVVVFEK